jgi:hypothetical protein
MLGHKDFFVYGNLFVNVVYIFFAMGFLADKPNFIDTIEFWLKAYMGIYILWRFNPLYPLTFNDFDRRVIFSAGMFLFTITVVEEFIIPHIKTLKSLLFKAKTEIVPAKPETA